MGRLLFIAINCICFMAVSAATATNDFDKRMKAAYDLIIHRYKTNATFAKAYDRWVIEQNQGYNQSFPCEILPPSNPVPTSVHRLRPGDIKVVSAIGDSLTAARGADLGAVGLLFDFPYLSWSIGGYKTFEDYLLLPNILQLYNPDLVGASPSSLSWGLDVANSGDTSHGILKQAEELVDIIKKDKNIDFEKDWKLVTLFIGGNDICRVCNDYEKFSAANYTKNIQTTLDYLKDNLPRTFVNLVELLNVDIVRGLAKDVLCEVVHNFACKCAAYPEDEATFEKLKNIRAAYQDAAKQIAESGRYDDKEDFTVVLQPFYRETFAPLKDDGSYDMSYFASDCFHESSKGQQAAAKALWNNMIEPVGSKRLDWHPNEPLECPTMEHPYLYTNLNSNLS